MQNLINALTTRVAALESDNPQPTLTPTPTPTPAATTNNACVWTIDMYSPITGLSIVDTYRISDTWTTDCRAANPLSSGTHYAKFFAFTLNDTEELEFRITSDAGHYYFLLAGEGMDGEVLHSGEVPSGDQQQLILQPGSYTLEITTRDANVTGDFTLDLNLRR